MRWMVGAMGGIVLAVSAAGCFGESGTAQPTGPTRPARPQTRVVIRASIGLPARRPDAITARCPALARCRPQRIPNMRPREWVLEAVRTLTCDPDRGGYRRPAAACRALGDLTRLEARPTGVACSCPLMLVPPPFIVGRVDGKHVSFTIDGCSLCGLPAHAGADARVLLAA
jgi:hypothetical protein